MTSASSHKLLISILLGIAIGALMGGLAPTLGKSVYFIGELFLKALFVLVVPLVMSSMIVGVGTLGDSRHLTALGSKTLFYFMTTTLIAVIIGLLLVNLIEPGTAATPAHSAELSSRFANKDGTVSDFLRTVLSGLIPKNIFVAMADADILPLIVFCLIFGAVLTTLQEKGQFLIRFFDGINDAIMVMVMWLMKLAPVGIGALIAGRLGDAGGFAGFWPDLVRLGAYAGTVILGLIIHAVIVLPLLLYFLTRKKILNFVQTVAPALTTAFSTASSSATLPLTMETVITEYGVSERVGRFVLPLGTTINMNGTALYEAVAALFIAQSYGIHLSFGQTVLVALTATLAAVGAAGIPEAGLVTMVMVLKAVHLPLEGIGTILIIDWLLDRCRTTVNVWGDAVGAVIIDAFEKKSSDLGVK